MHDPDCSMLPVPEIAKLCPDGSSVGATYVLEHHECVLVFECPTDAAAPDAATPPLVCDGPLPDLCELCSDGKSACAHHVIQDGKCTIEICPADAGPAPIRAP